MRDGTVLLGDRWFAASTPLRPVILMRSPYGRSVGFATVARLFAERGFQVFLQSCRGTGGSGGSFNPVFQESADGLDTLDWLERQTWCVGPVFTFGMSYLGMAQWAIAAPAGNRIAGLALHCTLSNYRNEVLAFNGLALEGAFGWASLMARLTSGKSMLALIWSLRKRTRPEVYNHLPLIDLDRQVVGHEIPWWRAWLNHPEPTDAWWERINHTRTISEVAAPAVMVSGWKDLFLPHQVRDFEIMQSSGRDAWLTIGPWRHTSAAGGAEAMRQGLELFTAVAEKRRPFADRARVRLYVVGAEQWRDYAAWPPPESRETSFYLRADGSLSTVPPNAEADPSRFIYDPADPTPSLYSPSPFPGRTKTPSMAKLEARDDTLVFTGEPLAADTDVVGPVQVELHFRSSGEYTDLYVCLCDVDLRAQSLKVTDGYRRLRPGELPADTQRVRRVQLTCWPTGYRFAAGHRLRLIVASGAHPRFARNLGTGEPPGTGQRMITQSQEIFHDARYPSALRIQICEGG